jgi:alkanesulfonate monooxygenase SsuD/methylene tetrahydromethanopterin reductase-like flavin-dependent oxidoreductase (luciferase family)
VKFGVILPGRGRLCTPENLVDVACRAEDTGFDSVWLTDHIAMPRAYSAKYPYTSSGAVRADVAADEPWLEIATAMTWVLARTRSVQVGAAVVVAALRPAVLLAKQLSTMAFLGGSERLIVGLGAGWLTEEIEALQRPTDNLGARLSDTVEIMRWCWSGAETPFVGSTLSVPPLYFAPGVPGERTLPILIGGHSRAALRRAVTVGDGWVASHLAPDAVRERLDVANALARDAGIERVGEQRLRVVCRLGPTPELDVDLIEQYVRAGVDDLVLDLPYDEMPAAKMLSTLEAMASVVSRARSRA